MAKIRRIVRKLPATGPKPFEDQLWPIYVALVLFGGFLMGVALYYAYAEPRPGAVRSIVPFLCLPLIPVLIGSLMALLYFVNTRAMRRGVQLAMVLSVIVHFFLFMWMHMLAMPGGVAQKPKTGKAKTPEKTIELVLEELPLPAPQEQQRDFEKPVETPTPLEPSQEIEKQPPQPEPVKLVETPQPTPQETKTPSPVPASTERAATGETAPRFSESPSLLSKQQSRAAPTTNRSADAPQVAAQSQPSEMRPDVTVAKQAPAAPALAPARDVATTTQPQTTPQAAKRSEQATPTTEVASAPKVERKTPNQQLTPAALAQVETPSTTKASETSDLTPRTISPDKRATASPTIAQNDRKPPEETPQEVKSQTQKRATETQQLPTLAQAAESVPVSRPRETARPHIASTAASEATSNTPQQASTNDSSQPANTSIAKTSPASGSTSTPATPRPAGAPATTASPGAVARRNSNNAAPSDSPRLTHATSPGRQSTKPGLASSTQASVANPAAAAVGSSGEPSPTGVAVRKQETDSPESAPAVGAASLATVTGTASTSPAAVATGKRPSAENAPTLAQQDRAAGQGRSNSKQALNVASTADTDTSNVGAQMAGEATALGPSSSQIARQPSNTPGATTSRQPLATESLTPTTQVASSGAQRASVGSSPTLNPSNTPTASPARATRTAEVAASPGKVETPSLATTATGTGDPSAQPARLAVTKSLAGTAGVGQSPNLDRSLPAADSASLVASGSARREAATQNTPPGPALAPSGSAMAGRSLASNNAPSASLKAETLDHATESGAAQVATVDATAGAALQKQSSNAAPGPISAAVGQVEVDLGPTQIVADSGSSSRASGGGQPTINAQTQSTQLARRAIGGSAAASLATDKVAEVPVAPAGTGGGAPKSLDVNTEATTIARTQAGGQAAVSGGPAAASQQGPATEVSVASLVGNAAPARNQNQAPGGAPRAAGEPTVSDQAAAARAPGRTSGGAPQLAVGGPVVAETTNMPQGSGGQPAAGGAMQPGATSVAKSSESGGGATASATGELAAPSSGGTLAAAEVGRAEATETSPGAPTAGGGQSARTRRTSTGPALAATTVADVPTNRGDNSSGGSSDGTPVASAGVEVAKQSGGNTTNGAMPAVAVGDVQVAGATQPGTASGQRAAGGSTASEAPVAAAGNGAGSPGRRASTIALAGGSAAAAQIDQSGTQLASASGASSPSGMERGQLTRQEVTGAIPVNVSAEEGPGGLGSEVAMDVGINSRRASSESMDVQIKESRFIRQKSGGNLDINTSAIVSTEGFRRRGPDSRGSGTGSLGPQTEQSVELGLVYLQRHQLPDGSWSLQGHDRRQRVELSSDTAATALAVLSFQGAGYSHREHKYKDVVASGLQYLIKNQRASGDLFVRADDASNASAWMYSHALATLALCEAYGMTGDPDLREPAQKAIDFIVASQSKELGGWRYRPREMSDTSVTGWMMMALKSGEYANLTVPAQTYAGVRKWLDISDGGQGKEYLFRYDPNAPDTAERRHGRVTSKTMTSVGLLMRLYLGWEKNGPEMQRGADFLLQNPPHVGTVPLDETSIVKAQRDTYYWYYTTQVMWHIDGETNGPYSTRWLNQMHPLLLRTQIQEGAQAGSWDPLRPEPDRWGLHAGRLYVTTMNLLSLEVKYRYLPIYGTESGSR